MKHTSWFIDPKAETHVISKDRAICSISFFDGDPKTREENKSIANLISAAPDLLEALEVLLPRTLRILAGDPVKNLDEVISQVRTAIAKAKGETS